MDLKVILVLFGGLILLGLFLSFGSSTGAFVLVDQNVTGADDFNELNDTPANYVGSGSQCVAVNAGETALEFIACGVGGGTSDGNFYSIDDFNILFLKIFDADQNYWRQVDLNSLLQVPDFNNMIINLGEGQGWNVAGSDSNWASEFPIFDANMSATYAGLNDVNNWIDELTFGSSDFNSVYLNAEGDQNSFGRFAGLTAGTYDGNIFVDDGSRFYGYVAGHKICAAEYSMGHMCLSDEINLSIADGNYAGFSGDAWIIENAPGYLANANDCIGFTDNDSSYLGAFWLFDSDRGGDAWLVNCASLKELACCS